MAARSVNQEIMYVVLGKIEKPMSIIIIMDFLSFPILIRS